MSLPALISNDGTPFVGAEAAALAKEASGANDNVLKRSLRGGVYGAGSQLLSAGAGVADALGADQVGAGLHAKSRSLRAEAALPGNAPRVGSYEQLSNDWSLDNAAEYVGGLVGGSLPATAAGIAGGIATGGAGFIPAALGAAGATLPFHMGEVVQQQQDDPQAMRQSAGQRFGNQLLGGAGAAAVEGLVPGMVGRQVLGKGMANLGKESIKQIVTRNAMDIPLEGFTEGAGTAVKGYAANQDKPTDWNQIKEAAIGGAAAGSVFTGVGTTADLAHSVAPTAGNALSSALTSTKEKLASAKDSLQGKADEMADTPTGKKVKTAYDDFSEMLGRGKKKADDTIDRIMKDLPPGVDLEEFAKAAPERAAEMATEGLKNGAAWAQKTGEEMLAKMVDGDPRRQAVVDALAKGGERTGIVAMAALKRGWDLAQKAGSKIDDFAHAVNNGYKADRKRQQNADIDAEARFVDDVPDDHMNPDGGWLQISNTESALQQAQDGPTPSADMSPSEKIKARKAFIEKRVAEGTDKRAASAEWDGQIAKAEGEKKTFIEERMVKGMPLDDALKEWESKPKKSEDYSGAQRMVLDVLQNSGLRDKNPELFADNRSINTLADTLRTLVGKMAKGPLDTETIGHAIGVLGESTASVMSSIRGALEADGADTAKTEQFFNNLNEIDAIQKRSNGLHDTMRRAFTDEAKTTDAPSRIEQDAKLLVAHARGDFKGKSPAEETFMNNRVAEFYAEHFGPKADVVRAAVEKEAGIGREGVNDTKVRLDDNGNEVEASEGGFDEQGNRLEKAEQEIMKFGLSKPDARGNSKSALNGTAMQEDSRYARQHLKDLAAKYPDYDVRFERLPESDLGHIVVEKRDNPGEFNDEDLAGMKLDAKKHSNSPSRIDVGGHIIDAVKVAKVMRRKMQDKFDSGTATSAAQRLVDGFKQGIAQLTDQFGEAINVPDTAVIGYLNGNKPLTWGAAQKIRAKVAADPKAKATDADVRELAALREQYARATWSPERLTEIGLAPTGMSRVELAALKARAKEIGNLMESDRRREMLAGDNTDRRASALRTQIKVRNAGFEATPFEDYDSRFDANGQLTTEGVRLLLEGDAHGGIDVNGYRSRIEEEGEKYEKGVLKSGRRRLDPARFDLPSVDGGRGRREVGLDENVHFASAAAGAAPNADLKRGANMDGTPQWVSDKANVVEALSNLAHELKARTSIVQRALGDKILGLTTTEVQVVMTDKDRASLVRVLALKKPSEQAAVVNPLAEKYGKKLEHVVQTLAPKKPVAQPTPKAEPADFFALAAEDRARFAKADMRWLVDEAEKERSTNPHRESSPPDAEGYSDPGVTNARLDALEEEITRRRNPKLSIFQTAINKRQDYLDNPPADYSAEKVRGILDWATQQTERIDSVQKKGGEDVDRADQLSDYRSDLRRLIADAKEAIDVAKEMAAADKRNGTNLFGGNPDEGSTPNPKAVAAKKAAFLARAASGDKALLAELSASTDAKGLQRAAAVLPAGKALDTINARLSELVQDENVAYGLGTKKYSMESTTEPGWVYHGTRAGESQLINANGDLVLKPSKNFGGKVNGVSFTKDADSAKDYAIRIKGGGPEGFTYAGAKLLKIHPDALKGLEEETFGELADYSGKDVVIPKGQFSIEPVARERYLLRDSYLMGKEADYSFRDYVKENYTDLEGEEAFDSPMTREEYLDMLVDPTTESSPQDVAEARAILRDEFQRTDMKFSFEGSYTSAVDEMAVYGKVWDLGEGIRAVEATHAEPAFGQKETVLQGKVYFEFFTQGGDQFSGWLDSLAEVDEYARQQGLKPQAPTRTKTRKGGFVEFMMSAQATDPNRNNTSQAYPGIKTYIERVLGKSVRLAWAKFAHAGEFQEIHGTPGIMGIIRLSVHALDPLSTAYHESLHAFIAQLNAGGNKDIAAVLLKAANAPHVVKRLNEMYKSQPAVLRQLADAEERAAYMYQAWAAGSLTVGPQTRSIFERIADLVRSVLGIWSNDQRALHIFQHFNSGEYAKAMGTPSANRAAMMAPGRNRAVEYAKPMLEPLGRLADAMVSTGDDRLRDTNIPALIALADKIKRRGTTGGGDQGFIPAARIAATKRLGSVAHALGGYSHETLNEALDALQSGVQAPSAEGQAAAAKVKSVLQEARRYMRAAGVDVGDLGPDYFPRVWDTHYISKNEQAFRDMLEPYVRSGEFKGDVTDFIRSMTSRSGVEEGVETNIPGMQHAKKRTLDFLKPEDAAPFLKKDLMGTLTSYINQAARRAEWERRLGWDDNLKDTLRNHLLKTAVQEGATPEQIATAAQYLRGVDGTLGDDLNPHARRLMGDMLVYQNVRLLPMAMFSMMVDPMGVMVRGGTITEAFDTFKRGMASIPATFRKDGAVQDEATRLAELVGVVDAAWLSHVMGDVYTQGMVGGFAEKVNHTFFKYNMVEGLNRAFRVGASEAAMSFIAKHADGKASTHSQRWIEELGLRPGDIKLVGKRIALTTTEGLTQGQVARVHAAINQWVDGAMLRPDAADRPIWMNDPHFALISHMKQFVFSFQKTILARILHEMKFGNYSPAMAIAGYVPMMIAADTARGLIQGGGDEPAWKKNWGVADYVGYGIQRAGLYGVGQFGVDAVEDVRRGGVGIGALTGPTLEQLADGVQAMGGNKQFAPFLLRSMPANALYKDLFDGGGTVAPKPEVVVE